MKKTKELKYVLTLAAAVLLLGACGREEEPAGDNAPATPPAVAPGAPAADAPAVGAPAPTADAPLTPGASNVQPETPAETVSDFDREYAANAFGSNIAHVQAGRLAAEKTLDENVRQFAQEMVKDHTASNEELTKIAQAKKIDLPMAPLTSFKGDLQELTSMTGPRHDRFYMERFAVTAHRDGLALYEGEIREGQDSELKRHAEHWVPIMRQHLERAEKIREGIDSPR